VALLGGKLVLILPHGAALRSIVSFAYLASNWTRPSGLFEGGHSGDFCGIFFWLLYFEETLLAFATPARIASIRRAERRVQPSEALPSGVR
jgi:hypothetical protein